jgi:hypothetical protein
MALVEGASPPVFEQIFRNARFAQGGNALFEGKVRGNPKPQVVWTRKGLQMKGKKIHVVRVIRVAKSFFEYVMIIVK